jgi:hypothetical protein
MVVLYGRAGRLTAKKNGGSRRGQTGEGLGTNRFEVVGTRGKLISEGGKLTFTQSNISSDEAIRGEGDLKSTTTEIDTAPAEAPELGTALGGNQHAKVGRGRRARAIPDRRQSDPARLRMARVHTPMWES